MHDSIKTAFIYKIMRKLNDVYIHKEINIMNNIGFEYTHMAMDVLIFYFEGKAKCIN